MKEIKYNEENIGPLVPTFLTEKKQRQFREKSVAQNEQERNNKIERTHQKKTKNKRQIKKYVVLMALITTAVIFKMHSNDLPPVPDKNDISMNIQKILDDSQNHITNIESKYETEYQQLEKQIEALNQQKSDDISDIEKQTADQIDDYLSNVATESLKGIFEMGHEEVRDCMVSNPTIRGTYYYDFSKFDKEKVINNWLNNSPMLRDNQEEIMAILSDSEKSILALYSSYNTVSEYEGGPANKSHLVSYLGLKESGKLSEQIFQESELQSKEIMKKIIKEVFMDSLSNVNENTSNQVGRRQM